MTAAAPALALAGLAAWSPPAVLGAVALSVVISAALRGRPRDWAAETWFVPALGAIALAAVAAPPTLVTELLAGASGLGLLYWISGGSRGRPASRERSDGLLLPGMAVALALTVTLFLPGSRALVGIASAILVGVLFLIAYLLSSAGPREGPGPATS